MTKNMQIWFDGIDINSIQTFNNEISGITTNPSILSTEKQKSVEEILQALLKAQNGPVAVQVTSNTAEGMVEQAKKLRQISDRIYIKVPVNINGLKAIEKMEKLSIPTMATTILNASQVYLADKAGSKYAIFYLCCIKNYRQEMQKMQALKQQFNLKINLFAAGVENAKQAAACIELGIPYATLPINTFNAYRDESVAQNAKPLTADKLSEFKQIFKDQLDVAQLENDLTAVLPEVEGYITNFNKDWNNGPHKNSGLFD